MLRQTIMQLFAAEDAKGSGESSTTQSTGSESGNSTAASTQEPTLADVAKEAYDKAVEAEGGSKESGALSAPNGEEGKDQGTEEPPGQGEGKEGTETEAKTEGEEGKGKKADEADATDPDAGLPFHNHPRWKEVLGQRNEFETKLKALEQEKVQIKPDLDWVQNHKAFVQNYGITDQEFVQAMNLLAAMKTDPSTARSMLKPVWESLQAYDEDAIPPEIQKMVDENEMTPAAAKQFAKLHAQLRKQQSNQAFSIQDQQRRSEAAINGAVADWDRVKSAADADFKPKAGPDQPDGLWEQTAKGFAYLQTQKFARSPQEVIQNLEKAYTEAKAYIARMTRPTVATKPTPSSTRSSATPKKPFDKMTVDEVVAATAARHGMHWSGRNGG